MISDEAVEAAANAISECAGMRFDGFWSRVEDLEAEDRDYALMEARAALEAAARTAEPPIVRHVDLTTGETDELDEVVARNAYVHLEAMADNHWWLLVTAGGKSVHVNFYTKRAKISGHAEIEP